MCIGCADYTGTFADCLVLKLTAVRSQIACLPSLFVNCVMLAVVVVVVLCLSVAVGEVVVVAVVVVVMPRCMYTDRSRQPDS